MRLVLIALLLALALPLGAVAQTAQQEVIGELVVRSGGAVTVGNRWFHLLGVAGPETDATCDRGGVPFACGLVSMAKLAEIAGAKIVHCSLTSFAGDSRWWGTCTPYDTGLRGPSPAAPSVNQEWVRSGYARAHTLHSDAYVADEAAARAGKRGLWAASWPDARITGLGQVEGAARALDGNTLIVGSMKVRLDGIDAPELDQTCRVDGRVYACGEVALGTLMDLVMGKRIACTLRRIEGDDRDFGTCREASAAAAADATRGRTLNERMVQTGWAVADRRTGEQYLPLEMEAGRARTGLWSGPFVPPARWRSGER